MTEEWKVLSKFPSYAISNLGHIKRIRHSRASYIGKILKPCFDSDGYLVVTLHEDDLKRGQIVAKVHQLVAKAFIGLPPEGFTVNHKDGDKANNVSTNLEYMTRGDNKRHSALLGMTARGRQQPQAKLSTSDVRLIRWMKSHRATWSVLKEVFGVSSGTINSVLTRRNWAWVK